MDVKRSDFAKEPSRGGGQKNEPKHKIGTTPGINGFERNIPTVAVVGVFSDNMFPAK